MMVDSQPHELTIASFQVTCHISQKSSQLGGSFMLYSARAYFCFFRLGYGSTVCAVCQRSGNRCIKLHTKRKESKSGIPVSALFVFRRLARNDFPLVR